MKTNLNKTPEELAKEMDAALEDKKLVVGY